jgi:hypothetical protein
VRENCRYRHKDLLPSASLCAAFRQGRCSLGLACPQRHDYAERVKPAATVTRPGDKDQGRSMLIMML